MPHQAMSALAVRRPLDDDLQTASVHVAGRLPGTPAVSYYAEHWKQSPHAGSAVGRTCLHRCICVSVARRPERPEATPIPRTTNGAVPPLGPPRSSMIRSRHRRSHGTASGVR
jgi:hypothetical protein